MIPIPMLAVLGIIIFLLCIGIQAVLFTVAVFTIAGCLIYLAGLKKLPPRG